jgi:methionine sulfoxide reductase heme-binding subunit
VAVFCRYWPSSETGPFGFGNYTGILAAVVFTLLLALSNDGSLRRLEVERWKSLQRWAYAGIMLTAAHGFAYQEVEKRIAPFKVVLFIVFGLVAESQILAAFKICRMRLTSSQE